MRPKGCVEGAERGGGLVGSSTFGCEAACAICCVSPCYASCRSIFGFPCMSCMIHQGSIIVVSGTCHTLSWVCAIL